MLVAIAVLGHAAPAAAQTADFSVGSARFTMPLPAGFCLPATAKQIASAEEMAAFDTDNRTDLTIYTCGDAPGSPYYIVKTPTNLVDTPMTRAQLLALLRPEFARRGTADILIGDTDKEMGEAISRDLGTAVELSSAVGPRGIDDVCAYIGGTMKVSVGAGREAYITLGACMTAVNGRVLVINHYARGNDPETLKQVLARARAVALTITAK